LTTFGISEEVVQGIKTTLSTVIGSMLTEITTVAHRIINGSV
jgi:hypothetical protein